MEQFFSIVRKNARKMRRMRKLVNYHYADPHHRILSDALTQSPFGLMELLLVILCLQEVHVHLLISYANCYTFVSHLNLSKSYDERNFITLYMRGQRGFLLEVQSHAEMYNFFFKIN